MVVVPDSRKASRNRSVMAANVFAFVGGKISVNLAGTVASVATSNG